VLVRCAQLRVALATPLKRGKEKRPSLGIERVVAR
jgi:hypothetical protein